MTECPNLFMVWLKGLEDPIGYEFAENEKDATLLLRARLRQAGVHPRTLSALHAGGNPAYASVDQEVIYNNFVALLADRSKLLGKLGYDATRKLYCLAKEQFLLSS